MSDIGKQIVDGLEQLADEMEQGVFKHPADVSRCNGHIYADDKQVCPQRDTCVRFLSPPHDIENQCWVFVIGSDQIGNCNCYWPSEE